MKLKNLEEMKDDINSLGMFALSKFSAHNHLSKLGIPLQAMIMFESIVREIECSIWTLFPLGLSEDTELFNKQLNHLTEKFNNLIEGAKNMKEFMIVTANPDN